MPASSQSGGPRGVKMSKKRITKSKRAGVTMPVGKIHRFLHEGRYAKRIAPGAAVYVGAAIEYLVAEVLDIAGVEAANLNRKRIKPRHINLSVRKDVELNELFRDVLMPEGGVVPFIHKELLMKRSKKSKPKSNSQPNSGVDSISYSEVGAKAHSQVNAQPDSEMDAILY